ncbi:MAG: S8 family serine peptidase [Polyangiaceae bacterium]
MKHSLAAFALFSFTALACSAPQEPEDTAEASDAIARPVDAFYVVLDGAPAVKSLPRHLSPSSPEAGARARARIAEIAAEQAAIEPRITSRGAVIVTRLSRLANAVQILTDEEDARRIEALPGVRRVERVPVLTRSLGTAVPLIGAPELWTGEPPLLGDGVTIGIIDSGIDYTHADFGGAGTPDAYLANDPTVIEPGSFPGAKIVGGWDFVGDAYNPAAGISTPEPDPDPLDCAILGSGDPASGHGTHVAGIAAGMGVMLDGSTFSGAYSASYSPFAFGVAPGVAPGASLYALKIFGCEGPTTMLAAALERAADPNEDGSFDDRLDIVNGSLGDPYGLGSPTEAEMVSALTGLGTLVVAAAGNEGASFFATSAPAVYPEVLSVAASVDNRLITVKATTEDGEVTVYPAIEGAFTTYLDAPVSAELVMVDPALACEPLLNAADVAGKIALIDRGECLFVLKLTNALDAGAVGVIMVDNIVQDLPITMGGASNVDLPGVMVTMASGSDLKDKLANGPVSVELDPTLYDGPGAELLSGLSSRGPSPVDGRLKPEISAPGGAIDSAAAGTGTGPRRNDGTSAAAPMVAGAAALVRQAQPGLSALELKAALVNATVPLSDFQEVPYGTGRIGGGRVDVRRAASARVTAAADPATGEVGVSFGAVIAAEPVVVTRTFEVTNHSTEPVGFDASLAFTHELPGVALSISPESADVAAGETALFELTLSLDPSALGSPGPDPGTPAFQGAAEPEARHYLNEISGFVRLQETRGGPEQVVLPFNGSVRAAVLRKASTPVACQISATASAPSTLIAMTGEGAHPDAIISAFELAALDDAHPDAATSADVAAADVRAVGIATSLPTAPSFEEARVFFGVAVTGAWTTPARGPVSLLTIAIDADRSGEADHELRVEAWAAEGGFRDALVARVYDLSTGEAIARHAINALSPDDHPTYPFYNSVLVLDALLTELGLDPEAPAFDWTVTTRRPDLGLVVDEVSGTFDAAAVRVDTTRNGLGKTPMFLGQGPLSVRVASSLLASATTTEVLLLHHTNVPGERWEVVSIVPQKRGNLALHADSPVTVEAGKTAPVTLTVENNGTEPTPSVTLTGNALDGVMVDAVADQGSCTIGGVLFCNLGDLEPGESATVTVTLTPVDGASAVALVASTNSALPCETDQLDNESKAVLGVGAFVPIEEGPDPREPLVPAGGCACRAGGPHEEGSLGSNAAWLVVAMGALAASRGRRARREHPRRGGTGARSATMGGTRSAEEGWEERKGESECGLSTRARAQWEIVSCASCGGRRRGPSAWRRWRGRGGCRGWGPWWCGRRSCRRRRCCCRCRRPRRRSRRCRRRRRLRRPLRRRPRRRCRGRCRRCRGCCRRCRRCRRRR